MAEPLTVRVFLGRSACLWWIGRIISTRFGSIAALNAKRTRLYAKQSAGTTFFYRYPMAPASSPVSTIPSGPLPLASRDNAYILLYDACYARGSTFRLNVFWMTGLLNPKSSEFRPLFFVLLVVYLGQGIIHPIAVLCFSKSAFGRDLKLTK